ncbi:MAG: hypothetical protein EXS14_10500 [Planctomycetes bacterium]|nr:hypothetical protein [Planctomycetota bacterium]
MRSLRTSIAVLVCSTVLVGLSFGLFADEHEQALRKAREQMAGRTYAAAIETLAGIQGDVRVSESVLEARLLQSRAQFLDGKGEQSAESARVLADALPADHAGKGRAHALLSEALLQSGQREAAARIYGDMARGVLSDAHKQRVAGYYLLVAKSLADGEISADPLKPGKAKDPRGAAELQRRALEVLSGGKPIAAVTLARARNLIDAGEHGTAAAELGALIEQKGLKERDMAEAHTLRARAQRDGQDYAAARTSLDQLLALPSVDETPYAVEGRMLLGQVLTRLGSTESFRQGIAAWRLILERYADHEQCPQVRLAIAEALFGAGLAQESIAALKLVAEDTKLPADKRAGASFNMGLCERQLENHTAARAALVKFIAAWPDDVKVPEAQALLPQLLVEQAEALHRKKDDSGAVAALKTCLDEYPLAGEAANVAVQLGILLRGMKQFDDAVAALTAARDRYREHDTETAARAGWLLGAVHEEDRHDFEAAVAAWKDVVGRFGGTAAAQEAARRIAQLENLELTLQAPRLFAPGETPEALFTSRNIRNATFRMVRLDAKEFFLRRGTLVGAENLEVELVKAEHSFTFDVPDWKRYVKTGLPLVLKDAAGKPLGEGAWLLSVEAEERRSVVLVLVSSVRVVVKESPTEVFCWAVDAVTGAPREGVEILVRSDEPVRILTTDAQGVARCAHAKPKGRCEVLAVAGASVAPGMPADPASRTKAQLAPRASFLLDRPVYRSGSEVRWRAVVREVKDGCFVTPDGAKGVVRMLDPRGRVLGEQDVVLGNYGTCHGSFMLPPEGGTGEHRLELYLNNQTYGEKFSVEEYKKPEFIISAKPKQRVVRPGEALDFSVEVAYFFGGRPQHVPFEWRAWREDWVPDTQRYLAHSWYLRAVESAQPVRPNKSMQPLGNGAGQLDEKGRANFTLRTPADGRNSRIVVQVFVKDTTGNWATGTGLAWSAPVDRFAVVLSSQKTWRAGDEAEARVITADAGYDGVTTQGTLTAFRVVRAAGSVTYEPETKATVDTGTAGEATVRLKLTRAGDYLLRFEGGDSRGAPVVGECATTVTGERPDLAKEALLRFERETALGGESANVHLSLPAGGRPVLLTVEGEQVLDWFVLTPTAAQSVLPVLMKESYAPNITLCVAAPSGDKLLTSEDSILVLAYLSVVVTPEKTSAAPREKVGVQLATRDQLGRPVAANVALRVVDQALSEFGAAAQDPRAVFNRDLREHLVRTGSSFAWSSLGETRFLDPDLLKLAKEVQLKQEVVFVAASLSPMSPGPKPLPALSARPRLGELLRESEPSGGDDAESADKLRDESGNSEGKHDAPGEKSKDAFGLVGGVGAGAGGGAKVGRALGGRRAQTRVGEQPPAASDGLYKDSLSGKGRGVAEELLERRKHLADAKKSGEDRSVYRLAWGDKSLKDMVEGDELRDMEQSQRNSYGFMFETALVTPTMRDRFLEVAAFWQDVVTTADGTVRVELDLPDNLTNWDFAASGMATGIVCGAGSARLTVTKPAIVRLETTRFLSTGDEAVVPVEVRNNLEQPADFRLETGTGDAAVLRQSGQLVVDMKVPGFGAAQRSFHFSALARGEGRLNARALSTVASDGIEKGLPIIAFGRAWTDARTQNFTDRTTLRTEVPDGLVPGTLGGTVLVHAGMDAELLDGLQYLASGGYGCLEQSLWRFLSAAELQAAFVAAGRPAPLEAAQLRRDVQQGFVKLLAHQRDDGTFSYWPGGAADAFSTAQALEGIARLEALHYTAPIGLRQSAVSGAMQLLAKGNPEPDARAALVLALFTAGVAQDAPFNALYRERAALSVPGLARLTLAARRSSNPALTSGLFAELKARRSSDAKAPFSGRGSGHWHNSALEANALALLAFRGANAGPADTEPLSKAVREGLLHRLGGTKAVAVALEALGAEIRDAGGLAAHGRVELLLDGKVVADSTLTAAKPMALLSIPVALLTTGQHEVTVVRTGAGNAIARFLFRAVGVAEGVDPSGNVLEVSRRITEWQESDAATAEFRAGWTVVRPEERPKNAPLPQLRQAVLGQKVSVELRVKAREDCTHLVIEDPLLATLEPIESGISGAVERHERRDTRLLFFRNRLRRGEELVLRYPAYLVSEGKFRCMPARVEELYEPARFGSGASGTLEVVASRELLAALPALQLTPDEIWAEVRRDFNEGRHAEAGDAAAQLLTNWKLVDDVHDAALELLLRSKLRTGEARAAVKAREDLQLRAPGRLNLGVEEREKLAGAYLEVGDPAAARELWQQVILEGFSTEMQVARTWREMGLALPALQQLRLTLLRYPAVGEVISEQRLLADWQLDTTDPRAAANTGSALRRVLWQQALDTWLDLMAWHPAGAIAEDAAWRRVMLYGQLGALEVLVAEAGRYRATFMEFGRADEIALMEAQALFAQKRFDEAQKLALQVQEQPWPRRQGNGSLRPEASPSRHLAGFLLGQLAHVAGDYTAAVEWYGKVKEHVAGARESHAFLTQSELMVAPMARGRPGTDCTLTVTAKNMPVLTARLHPVDLLVLFAVKKDFAAVAAAELPGIAAAAKVEEQIKLKPYTRGEVELDLGRREAGAWLVVLEGGGRTASTLLLVSDANLVVQRDAGTVRLQFTGTDGKPVAGARVKMGHKGRIVQSGETDLRGMLDLSDPGSGEITVVAERGADVGVARQ